jgi:predicted transcriptional regulator of viral defense system
MGSYKYAEKINNSNKTFFNAKDLALLLGISNRRNLENTTKSLLDSGILTLIEKGKYYITRNKPDEFEIAQFIYSPSYISFETALNYHGILSQFPLITTSATTKKSVKKIIFNKEYFYTHMKKELFYGFEKNGDSLIAFPEKALVDQMYLSLKGIKSLSNIDEYNLSNINKDRLDEFIEMLPDGFKIKAKNLVKKYL